MNRGYLKHLSVLAGLAVLAVPAYVSAGADMNDTVIDERGNQVVDSNGNCVRTRWEANYDECGRAPEKPMQKAAEMTREDRTVYFEFNKAELSGEAKRKLNSLAQIITNSRGVVRADIVGYADRIGTDDYNYRLSQKRAQNVAQFLSRKGLDTRVAEVRALGKTASADSCQGVSPKSELVKCLWRDRRVEVELEYYTDVSKR